ncbi:hypothetical protein G9A89_004729 [Geosiphon pyriformis]|nr:hypothetical protein G9A89_004729 [Geosiphon pyriformis]
MWSDIPGHKRTCDKTCQYTILINNWVSKETPINDAWKRVLEQLEEYPHDKDELWRMAYAKTEDMTTSKLLEIKNNPLSFLESKYIQTFDYCNECDLIYNPLPHMIYTIPEEEEPISSCASESELNFNSNSNSDNNNNKNTGSSSIQYGESNDNDSNSDLNSDPNYEQYIALFDLTKEQELK